MTKILISMLSHLSQVVTRECYCLVTSSAINMQGRGNCIISNITDSFWNSEQRRQGLKGHKGIVRTPSFHMDN